MCCELGRPPAGGAQGAGIIGNTAEGPHELEQSTGLSLSLASLPGVEARIAMVDKETLPDAGIRSCQLGRQLQAVQEPVQLILACACADASPEKWQELVGVPIDTPQHVNFVQLVSPFFQQQEELIAGQPLSCAR